MTDQQANLVTKAVARLSWSIDQWGHRWLPDYENEFQRLYDDWITRENRKAEAKR